MKEDLISVIVPIYNIEDYVETCVNSILKQTYKNIEILLIDDGSTDGSGEICEKLKRQDSRIVVYHKENGGLSSARNYGISKAKGEYITTIDGDDFVGENYVQVLYRLLIENDADISLINRYTFIEDDSNGILKKELYYQNLLDTNIFNSRKFEEYILKDMVPHEAWGKLYKKEIFANNKYKEGLSVYEDLEFLLRALRDKTFKIVYNPEEYQYYYRKRNSSIMNGEYNECWEKEVEYLSLLKEDIYYKKFDKNITHTIGIKIIRNFVKIAKCRLDTELIRKLKRYLSKSSILKINGLKNKIKLLLIKLFPNTLYKYLSRKTKSEVEFIKSFNEYIRNNNEQAFIFNGPTTGNMGDHAILFAEERLLKEQKQDPFLISSKEMRYLFKNNLHNDISPNANIYITGGGNTGTLWRNEQERINTILKSFYNYKITIFPQTIYYSNDYFGEECLKKDKKIYQKCTDLIFECRDKTTYEFVREKLEINALLKKDIEFKKRRYYFLF